MQPARDWFDGVARKEAPRPAPAPEPGPRAMEGFGRPRPGSGATSARPRSAAGTEPHGRHLQPRAARPASVTWACAITWVFCGLALLALLATVLVLATVPDLVFDEVRAQDPEALTSTGMSESEIASASLVTASLLILWCTASIVFAVFAFRRARWGRVALLASVGGAVVFCLASALASALMLLPLLLSTGTLSLLLRPSARTWFAGADRGSVAP